MTEAPGPKLSAAQAGLAARLGHEFRDTGLLVEALTHASVSSPVRGDNQRLEFLGDRVLGLVIAEALLGRDKDAPEGTLAPRFNQLVRKETCAEVAQSIGIGDAMVMGRSERATGGRRKTALLGDAMEAVIAALYRDAGFDATRRIILKLWGPRIDSAESTGPDPKTALQEWAQARGMSPPKYNVLARSGPDHAPHFTIEARLENGETAEATASSKRAAQQDAARKLLDHLGNET